MFPSDSLPLNTPFILNQPFMLVRFHVTQPNFWFPENASDVKPADTGHRADNRGTMASPEASRLNRASKLARFKDRQLQADGLMEGMGNNMLSYYCWWLKSCTTWDG